MKKTEIQTLYQYNSWANARILKATAEITEEQFLADASFSYGGIRGALVHTLFAEWIWRERWEGHSPTKWLLPEEFSTFDALQKRWQAEEEKINAFIENLSEADLDWTVHYKRTGGKSCENILWHLMVHLVNHGTQHRSEAAAMLTEFGQSPGDIDLVIFLRETNQ